MRNPFTMIKEHYQEIRFTAQHENELVEMRDRFEAILREHRISFLIQPE